MKMTLATTPMSSPRRTPRTYCAVAVKVVLVMLMLQAPSFAGECFYVEVASCIKPALQCTRIYVASCCSMSVLRMKFPTQ